MASKVKCINCNIVICEVLAYVQNRMDVMDEESLVKLCTSSFSEKDIEAAKSLLFESVSTSRRKISRKRTGKSQRDLYDVITLLKETDPEEVPIFVARELHKLPPVSFDHLDASKLLKDILLLQNDLKIIKESYVTTKQLEDLKTDYDQLKLQISSNMQVMTNEIPHIVNRSPKEIITREETPSLSLVENLNDSVSLSQTHTSVAADNAWSVQKLRHAQSERSKPQATSGSGNETLNELGENEWTTVKKKKPKYRFAGNKGKAVVDTCTKFRAAEINTPLFITGVAKDVSESEITKYIESKTQISVTIKKINMKKERNYDAYKIFVPQHKIAIFLNDNLWPEGISFRRFIYINKDRDSNNSNNRNGELKQK